MATFWPSNGNKIQLEKLIYSNLRENASRVVRHYPTVVGQVTREDEDWHCIKVHEGTETVLDHLQSTFEEADLRIPIHILDALDSGYSVCVVVSNNPDVVVALLYHMQVFLQHNLEELWVRAGLGDTTRYVPLHTLFQNLGQQLCAVLPALYSLTGCDITSKVGTKKAALKADPERFLKHFATSPFLSAAVARNAERYLVKVLRRGSDADDFVTLRAEIFHCSKNSSLYNLPPTSQGLHPHIQRGFYAAYTIMHALENHLDHETESLKPEDYGYVYDQGHLMPASSWKNLDFRWSVSCTCQKCAKSTCSCRMSGVKCGKFCRCKKTSPNACKNPIVC